MSIIEKAMNKLEGKKKKPEVVAGETSGKPDAPSLIESLHLQQAVPEQPETPAQQLPEQPETPPQHVPERAPSPHVGGYAVPTADSGVASESPASEQSASRVEIPFESLSEMGMITPQTPRSQIAEEYRSIKRPLLQNISGKHASSVEHANLIMVTSALQGDGKTFSAINLALSIAMEQDKTVLFVDADVSKATAGRVLGADEDAPGLIDLLDGSVKDASDVILKTNVHNLRILPAGNLHDRATELLASENMRELMVELSRRYRDRVIVFDSPPLLLTTEAGVLTSFMGQIVFVVAAESTPASAVTEAIQHIGSDKVIGMVLNKARRGRLGSNSYKYGYGGYGYGYGYSRRKEKAAEGE